MLDMYIDSVTNIITLTRGFYEASREFGSEEYKKLQLVKAENPQMNVVVRTARSGNRKCDYKGLTYEYMRKFIRVMDRDNMIVFEEVIDHYKEFGQTGGQLYQSVKDWFLENYPHHKEIVVDTAPKKVPQRALKEAPKVA